VLWVISHPDSVEPAELDGYDLVFAASHPWSAAMSERSGREVIPLLQATEVTPPTGVIERRPGAVFVGNRYDGRDRPIVDWALEVGIPLTVHGRGWEGRLPEGVWASEYLDPRRLPEVYAAHEVVLADHWPDMARHGFVANRVFDGLAAGAVVVCDPVAGLDAVLRSAVHVVRDADELRGQLRLSRGGHGSRTGVADLVANGHSFAARAEVIAQAVTAQGRSDTESL
jgi:hypothetical protein